MAQTENRVLSLYRKLESMPLGGAIFARALCMQAPYFSTIAPSFGKLAPGEVVVRMKNRRAVHNHIGTVHALAVGNLCELAAGTMMEVTVPSTHRWIPKGMNIEYLKKAETDLEARCTWDGAVDDVGIEVPVTVHVTDAKGVEVTRAVIRMWVSPKKAS